MAVYYALGPGGYPKPPYDATLFGTKVPTVPSRVYTQTFSVLGPGGYPRPPYVTALFATKVAATPSTTTNSGVQRLRAFHGDQAYYREVQRREALQVQQIRLAELQQQQREVEAKRISDEALRKAGAGQREKIYQKFDPDYFLHIEALKGELAALNSAIIDTRAEIARLDAIEVYEALLAEQAVDDETILILAASL